MVNIVLNIILFQVMHFWIPTPTTDSNTSTGPKISKNVNYTQRGTMEESKTPSEARRVVLRGWGLGRGAVAPPVWGSGSIAPRKFWNWTVQICSFFPRFQDRDSSSIRCFSFIYCLYLFIVDHPVAFRKVITAKQNSEIWQSISWAKLCLDDATLELNR